ncbi:hypothetical protein N9A94_03525 [Akkermansiaceae bacterium]|nr:hypothetical protein [Akkermansiaceae bacterium]
MEAEHKAFNLWNQRTVLFTRISYSILIGTIGLGFIFEETHPLWSIILGIGSPVFASAGILSGVRLLTLADGRTGRRLIESLFALIICGSIIATNLIPMFRCY